MKKLKILLIGIIFFNIVFLCINPIMAELNLKNKQPANQKILKNNKQGVTDENKIPGITGSNNYYTIKLFFIYAILIAVGLGVYYFFVKKVKTFTHGDLVNLIYNYPITTGKYIQIIDVLGEYYLIGLSSNNISLITKLDSKEIVHKLDMYKSEKNANKDFKSFFISKKTSNKDIEDLINKNKTRLKDL